MQRLYEDYLYDTENSKIIAEYESPFFPSNFKYYKEWLYQAPNGKFFLYGEGNGSSPYGCPAYDSGMEEGADLRPLTFDEAKKWYQDTLDKLYRVDDIMDSKDPKPNYPTYCRLFKKNNEKEKE